MEIHGGLSDFFRRISRPWPMFPLRWMSLNPSMRSQFVQRFRGFFPERQAQKHNLSRDIRTLIHAESLQKAVS